ncbi:phage baseplate assembly protein V [uncultured Flavobacterium sp.]|uniref:type VI secretion system Vgr family protein n=1 Tax=uncultured Flavobacterium sp. TaxID=165435 RepID=UPI0025FE0270|nr:phage baseplate assembly protein V [uncultured Flavobacterium sp.]
MLVNDIDPIRKKIIIKISNYEKTVNFSGLKIRQELLAHAKFEFFWRISDKIATEPSEDFDSFKKFFGMEVMFSFFNFVTQKEMLFKGLIDGMEIQNRDGASAGFLVKGHSHTIAMEDLKHSRQHLDKSLKDIFTDSLKGHTLGMWEPEDIAPAHKDRLPSSLQSNEHSWKYLARLAKNYGEWLYWDGTRLQVGRLKDSKMTLINGIHLKSFGMGSKLLSNKSSFSGYDYNAGSQIQGQLEKTEDNFNDSLMNTSLNAQKLHYIRKMDSDIPFHSYSLNAQNQGDIDRMNKLETAGKAIRMITYSVESHVPVNVGHVLVIKNKTVDHPVIVTKSEITSVGVGNLLCKFEAIPADAKHPPYTNPEKQGKAKSQPAIVLDNNDPAGMGRVKVKYFWGKSDNESDWIRFPQAHAGSGKGFYFIPEIGEEVLVGFEGGNPDKAFVSGANYNGSAVSGYADSGNNVKAIHTRSGTKILLNDGEGSVFIEDPSGNTWMMDGKGNISVNAPKNMVINVGENLDISVGKNMTTNIGNDNNTSVQNDNTLMIQNLHNLITNTYNQTVNENKEVKITGDLKETTSTTTHKALNGDILMQSAGIAKIVGAIDAKVNKG